MTTPSSWRDVKARAGGADMTWGSAERTERRAKARAQMLASVSGAQLAEIRGELGLTQAQLAEATGLIVLGPAGRLCSSGTADAPAPFRTWPRSFSLSWAELE